MTYIAGHTAAFTRIMLIFIPSVAIFVFLVVLPADARPVLGKPFDLDSVEVGFNPVKDPDFSSQYYRLVSSVPDNKDDLANEVVTLLKENRMLDNSPEQTVTSFGRLGDNVDFRRYNPENRITSDGTNQKRNLKFNPTGWRKKRSADNFGDLGQLSEPTPELQRKKTVIRQRLADLSSPQHLSKTLSVARRSNRRSYQQLDDIIAHIRSLLAKRKGGPLDFNPTGW